MHLSVMSTKTITIKTEAYERLRVRKKARESFTDVINRLTGRRSLLDFAGILSEKSAAGLEKSVAETRRSMDTGTKKIARELNDP